MPRRKRPELNIGLHPPVRDQRREYVPWQRKVKWQMEQAAKAGHWSRYRMLKRKLDYNPGIARRARFPGYAPEHSAPAQ